MQRKGKTTEARAESQRLSAAAPAKETEVEELRRAGLVALNVGNVAGAQTELTALAKLIETEDSAYTNSCYYNLKGAIELATHKPGDAEESQRRAAVYLPFFSAYEDWRVHWKHSTNGKKPRKPTNIFWISRGK